MRLLILALAACAAAHESCCEKAAEAEPEFIIDPDDAPPYVYEGLQPATSRTRRTRRPPRGTRTRTGRTSGG